MVKGKFEMNSKLNVEALEIRSLDISFEEFLLLMGVKENRWKKMWGQGIFHSFWRCMT